MTSYLKRFFTCDNLENKYKLQTKIKRGLSEKNWWNDNVWFLICVKRVCENKKLVNSYNVEQNYLYLNIFMRFVMIIIILLKLFFLYASKRLIYDYFSEFYENVFSKRFHWIFLAPCPYRHNRPRLPPKGMNPIK